MKTLRRITAVSIGTALSLLATAGAAGAAEAPTLKPGELVYIDVYRQKDLTTSTEVSPSGTVSLPYIGNVSVEGLSEAEAADRVARALTAILKNPRVTVSRTAGAAPSVMPRTEQMRTELVPLENSSAEVIFNALAGVSSAGGSVNFDPDTNTLIMTDTPSALQNMLAVVRELDQMQSQLTQVHIEARIADVQSGALKELGVRWFVKGDHASGGYYPNQRQDARVNTARGADALGNERIQSGNNGANTGTGRRFIDEGRFDRRTQIPIQVPLPGQMFFGYLNAGIDLGILLDALVADSKAELLATPYIRTVNNKPAAIRMVEEFPYTELSTAGLSTVANVRFIEVGITLDVTPHVRRDPDGDAYVQLELEPEVSTATGVSNGVPVRSVRSSHSIANVRDGQTLVIGGIVQSDVRDTVQKVPGLGDLPLLGRLFKHKEKSKEGRELMIFVTPTLYDRPEAITWDRSLSLTELAPEGLAPLSEARAETRKD